MKSLRVLLVMVICLGTMNLAEAQVSKIEGSGKVSKETRDLKGFTGVKTSTAVDVYLSQGTSFSVEVEADDNLIDKIVTEVKDGVLHVYVDRIRIIRKEKMVVHVTMMDIDYISASSAGDVIGMTPIMAEDLKIRTSSAGDVQIEVTAKTLDLSTSSSGDITISGSAEYLVANTSSAGDIKGYDLTVREADVSASSAGDVKITVTQKLKARASSAGDIYYMGDPEFVDAHSSSAGDVVKK